MSKKDDFNNFLRNLMEDGFTKEEAMANVADSYRWGQKLLDGVRNQEELENRLKNGAINPNKILTYLPGVLKEANFSVDIKSLFNVLTGCDPSLSPEGRRIGFRGSLQNYSFWASELTVESRSQFLEAQIQGAESAAGYYLALYFDKISSNKLEASLNNQINQLIVRQNELLPLLSVIGRDNLPECLQKEVDPYLDSQGKGIKSERIKFLRRTSSGVGRCAFVEQHFPKAFREEKGLSLLSVKGDGLVGAVKNKQGLGDPSIFGLTLVYDSNGREVVVPGGVYSTTKQVTQKIKSARDGALIIELDELLLKPLRFIGDRETRLVYLPFEENNLLTIMRKYASDLLKSYE